MPNTTPNPTARRAQAGFTLIEVMIVVVIIGVIAGFAFPAYQESGRKAKRTDAKRVMLQIAAQQEQFYAKNMQYARSYANIGFTGTTTYTTEDATYIVTMTALPADTTVPATSYTLTAVPQGGQAADKCLNLTYSSTGVKGTSSSATKCW